MEQINRKHYWEMTEADGLTSEKVKFNRHLHQLKVAKDQGKKLRFASNIKLQVREGA
jgi:hypothetical protein